MTRETWTQNPWMLGHAKWETSDGLLVDPYDKPLPGSLSAGRPGPNLGREPANKGKRYPIEILTPGEVVAMMEQIPRHSRVGVRNRAFLAVLYRAGLRCNEARHLRSKDIWKDYGAIRVLFGKGGRARTVAIDSVALKFISAWERRRAIYGYPQDAPLFCTSNGRLLSGGYIRTFVKKAGREAGITKRVHPHGLRHTHAFELTMEGMPIPIIQQQLGHRFATTTVVYISHIAPADLLGRIRGRTWILPPELTPDDGLSHRAQAAANVVSLSAYRSVAHE